MYYFFNEDNKTFLYSVRQQFHTQNICKINKILLHMCLWYKLDLSFILSVKYCKGMCSCCMCNVFSSVKLNFRGWKSVICHYMKKVSRSKLLLQLLLIFACLLVCLFCCFGVFLLLILYLESRIYKRQQFWSKVIELTWSVAVQTLPNCERQLGFKPKFF